jgi:hypothetical protein
VQRQLSRRQEEARAAFHARVAELGGVVVEEEWLGVDTAHRVLCPAGHEATPRPTSLNCGQGLCKTCARKDPRAADQAFRARVAGLGGTVLETAWLGSRSPHRVRCAAGHEMTRSPDKVASSGHLCRICTGKDSASSEAIFRARVAELGGTVLEPKWLGALRPHRIRCAAGHESAPWPSSVRKGQGICRLCAGKQWDAFYVVVDDVHSRVKFGITSGDPRPRVQRHAANGYTRVLRLMTGLPNGHALGMERSTVAALRDAQENPVQGREYFDSRALPIILAAVDAGRNPG